MPIGRHRLKKSIKNLNFTKLDEITEVPGILGITLGGQKLVDVPNREGFVYVRLRDNLSELVQAYNAKVSAIYDLPVLVYRDKVNKTRWIIKGRDEGRYANWGLSPYLPAHGAMHSFNPEAPGMDIVWVYGQQFIPLLAVPSGSNAGMSVIVYPGTFYNAGNWLYVGATGTSSFAGYKPTDNTAKMVLITIDSNGNPVLTAGSTFPATMTGTGDIYSYIPDMPANSLASVGAVRLVSGTSIITWENLYDVRQFFGGNTTGTSGGSGTDEKVKVSSNDTTAGYLNGKLIQGPGISLTELNNGGDETFRISFTGTVVGGSSITLSPNSLAFSDSLGTLNYNYQFKTYSGGTGTSFPRIVLGTKDAATIPDGPDDVYSTYTLNVVARDGYSNGSLGLYQYSPAASPYVTFHRSKGTETGTSPVVKDDSLGSIAFAGMGTPVGFYWGSAITAFAEETFNVAGAGTRIEFYVAPTGSVNYYDHAILTLRDNKATVDGDVEINSGSAYYYGSPIQDGSWRTRRDAGTFVFEKRESGNWINQTLFSGGGSNLIVYDNSIFKVTGTAISFDDGLVVHVTGSIAYVSSTGSVGGSIANHDHSGDTGDGGQFDPTNLSSIGRSIGDILVADGSGGIDWSINISDYINDHDHSMDDWSGGPFPLTNLMSSGASINQVPYADGSGGISWGNLPAGISGGNTLLLYDNNVFKVTGTAIHFNDGLNVITTGSVAWIDWTGSSTGLGEHIYIASQNGAVLDTDLTSGGGTDDTTALQAILNNASDGTPIMLIMDGPALISGLNVYSNTTIYCLDGAGFYLKNSSRRAIIRNVNRSRTTITDEHISLIGGYYNGNNTNQLANQEADDTFVVGIQMYGVNHLIIRDVMVVNHRMYAVHIANVNYFTVENLRTDCGASPGTYGADGLHLNGPASFGYLNNFKIKSNDDALALNAGDGEVVDLTINNEAGPYIGQGLVQDVIADGIELEDCKQGIRLLSHDGNSRINRVTIRNVRGTVNAWSIANLTNYNAGSGSFGTVVLEDWDVTKTETSESHIAGVSFDPERHQNYGFGIAAMHENLTIRNIKIHSPIVKANGFWITSSSAINSFTIDGFSIYDTNSGAASLIPIRLDGYVKEFKISNVNWYRSGVAQAALGLISLSNANSRIDSLIINGVIANLVDHIVDHTGGTLTNIQAVNVRHSNAIASFYTTGTVERIDLSNYYGNGALSGTFSNQYGDAFLSNTISNHDHSGDVGDGGQFRLVNLTSVSLTGTASSGHIPYANGAGGITWSSPPAGGVVDATDVTYTPAVLADWDGGSDPGDADNALDQLAERVTDLEMGSGSSGSGDSTFTSTYASRPAASNNGNLFLPSDGYVIERDTGVAWASWGPIYPMTKPVLADFAWINQGSGTATDAKGAIELYDVALAAINYRILKKSSPSRPFNVTACFNPATFERVNYHGFGMCWRQSSDGKLITAGLFSDSNLPVFYITKNSAPVTPTEAAYTTITMYPWHPIWIRLTEDNTNRTVYYSLDGQNFQQLHQVGRTDYLTADEVGIFYASRNATYPLRINWLSWVES